jgi:hypothetical protein
MLRTAEFWVAVSLHTSANGRVAARKGTSRLYGYCS